MKSRQIKCLIAVTVAVLAGFAIRQLIANTPIGTRQKAAVTEAGNLYKWIHAWSTDHGGIMPDKLEALKNSDIGVPDDFDRYLEKVIDYRGGGQKFSELDKDFVILRYRAGRNSEARVYADGRSIAFEPE